MRDPATGVRPSHTHGFGISFSFESQSNRRSKKSDFGSVEFSKKMMEESPNCIENIISSNKMTYLEDINSLQTNKVTIQLNSY